MSRREADGARIIGDVVEADRPGVVDQRAQHAATLGQVADGGHLLGRHAHVDELLEPAAVG